MKFLLILHLYNTVNYNQYYFVPKYFHNFIHLFNQDTHNLYVFGITIGLQSIFGNFSFSHLACIGLPVIETTLTSHQPSRRFQS